MEFIFSVLGLLFLTKLVYCQNSKGSIMEQRMSFITLGVKDLKISTVFYENKFG